MRTAPSLLALAIASALSFPLHAETPADADGTRTLDPVEVKAQREKQASANQNVTVIGAGQIEDEIAESMEDLIRYIPGVSIVDMGRFGDNGFHIRGIEGDRVAMTIAGLRMSEGRETARSTGFFRPRLGGVARPPP